MIWPQVSNLFRELLSHALAYVQATEVGGTHPALVEAMGYGNCVLVNDTPENREVAGEAGIYFEAGTPDSLTTAFERVRIDDALALARRAAAARRARDRFSWTGVVDSYCAVLNTLCGESASIPSD